jgi:hypothetical protein
MDSPLVCAFGSAKTERRAGCSEMYMSQYIPIRRLSTEKSCRAIVNPSQSQIEDSPILVSILETFALNTVA